MEYIQNLKFTNDFWIIVLPCVLMLIDVITGYYNAWKNKKVSSSKMRDGLGKKIAEICYIVVGLLIGLAFEVKAVTYLIALYVVYMELVSVFENCSKLGIPTPSFIKEKLKTNNENIK